MKKTLTLSIFILLFSGISFASNFFIGLNINYGQGTSDFFNKKEATYLFEGQTFIENRQNKVGLGFNLTIYIPLVKNLYICPGYSIHNSSQHYEYTKYVGENEYGSQKADYFFQIHSGEFNILYDFLKLKNGWVLSISAGLTYNFLKKDAELNFDMENYLGFNAGLRKHFGFQAAFFYKTSFSDPTMSFITGYAGVIYRL